MRSIILFLSILLCSGFAFAQDCASITVTGGNGQINVTGLSGAPIATVQVFNSSWASVFNQTYNNPTNSVTVTPLAAGQYFVNVRLYTGAWAPICEKGTNATVTNNQPPPADVCGGTFQKTVGLPGGSDEAINIAKSSDGGYIAVGQSAVSGTTNHDGMVMKFDSKGSLLWSKTVGSSTKHDYFEHIVATADGGCLAAGATNSDGLGTYPGDCWLVRFDGNGNILWQKRYPLNGNSGTVGALAQTSDGGFAFAGAVPNTPSFSDCIVVKLDANGIIQWQRRFGSSSSDGAFTMIEDNHGGAGLVIGSIVYSGATWYDAVITKLDLATGNIAWTKRYDFDSRRNWPFGSMYKVSDGFVFNIREADGWENDNPTFAILKTDFEGNLLWIKEYAVPNGGDNKMIVLPDGGFMIQMSEYPRSAASDIYLMKIDAGGNITWTKKYARAGAQWLAGLISDGNFIVGAGVSTTGSYYDVLLAKGDLDGKFGTCTSTTVTGTSRTPVVNTLTFSWPSTSAGSLGAIATTYPLTSITPVENVWCADACPSVTVSSVTVSENAGNATVQVCISSPAANDLVYGYITADGSANSGSDYTGGPGTVTILAGQTCGTITIPIMNDATTESSESFIVSVGSITGTVTINDDDQAQGNCNAVTFTPGNNIITVSGITAPVATVQVFNSNWASVFSQTYTNAPGTVNVPIGAGTYQVKVTFYTSGWAYVCDKTENVTVINTCPAGTICVTNTCPSETVNLNTAYSIPNLPPGTTVSWHTATPATDANKMTDAQVQNAGAGTYYVALYSSGPNCYSATIPVTVTIVACSSAAMMNAVELKTEGPSAKNITVFPNPFTRSIRVVIDSEKKEKATLILTDVQGRQLKQVPMQLVPGSNTTLIEGLDQFPLGNYFLKISSDSGMKTLKVIRQQ